MSLLTDHSFPSEPAASMDRSGVEEVYLTKRCGTKELLDPQLLFAAIAKHCSDLPDVDVAEIHNKVMRGLYNGVSTVEIDSLLIQNAAMYISDEPQYSQLAARLLYSLIVDEVRRHGITNFSDSIKHGYEAGIISSQVYEFVEMNASFFDELLAQSITSPFEYFGLRTVYDRYLLKDPKERTVFETPQYFFLRVACGLARSAEEAAEFYNLISSFEYMPSTPTLFNSATRRSQMSSCYLLDSPQDSLESIYDKYKDVALLSKFAGGIGLAYHRVRSQGSLIKGTNGKSNGVIPFLKTLDSSVSAVNQGGKRKGAACIYLESWHADILDFLQLRENTGDESRRTHNLNLANWIPDLFMERVQSDDMWSLFDPADVPHFPDQYGKEFAESYLAAEEAGLARTQIKARELYAAMMKCLAQTGNGWMTFKDASNEKCNQVGASKDIVHLSNLCTEIIEVTSNSETAVCNLGSINLSLYVKDGAIDYKKLADNVQIALKYLDRVIDINFYPIDSAESSNARWRPVGLGLMGLQDAFFKLDIPFDSARAREISARVQEEIYFNALKASCQLAKEFGSHDAYEQTRISREGNLQFDLWGVKPSDEKRWSDLKADIKQYGLRNSLMIAIAPTATIASICGSYECIEPQLSNLFKRETLSGEFLQVNSYLVKKLKSLGMWNDDIKSQIKLAEGSIQSIREIPEAVKEVFRTVWEVPMRSLIDMAADRGAYIDQSQSLNLFIENPTIGKLSSMYNYAWKKGLKTSYYLRSRAATKINKTTVTNTAAVACSLENPETCEACQ